MQQNPLNIILASNSPRRKQLLEEAGVSFVVHAAQTPVDESLEPDLEAQPEEAAKKLAERKAGAVVQEVLGAGLTGLGVVIGADTMVVLDGEIFGKPVGADDAKRMIARLSGNTHKVITGVSVWFIQSLPPEDPTDESDTGDISLGFRTFTETTEVTFRDLSDEEIAAYVATGESVDKAGAYAIQGGAADFVASIDGLESNVIGLPVETLLANFPDLLEENRIAYAQENQQN